MSARLGVHTSSFRRLPIAPGRNRIDALIEAVVACDVRECELAAAFVEPAFGNHQSRHHSTPSAMSPQMMRRELRKWRLRTPLSHFEAIGNRFRTAGVAISAYNSSPDNTFSDEEIERVFSIARRLGAEIVTAAIPEESARRVAPFADKHRMVVATTSSEHETVSVSRYFQTNVDLEDLSAANVDPVAYIREHHMNIASVHVADGRRHREALQVLARERWPIRIFVDYRHDGDKTAIDDVKRCVGYAREALT